MPSLEETQQAAEKRYAQLLARAPWLGRLSDVETTVGCEPGEAYVKLVALAHRAGSAIQEVSPCSKGCSHCCYGPVMITSFEAAAIGRMASIAVEPVARRGYEQAVNDTGRFAGAPCPFLEHGNCRIYGVRPTSCVLHHSLDATPFWCSSENNKGKMNVPQANLVTLDIALIGVAVRAGFVFGDIREFFPRKA